MRYLTLVASDQSIRSGDQLEMTFWHKDKIKKVIFASIFGAEENTLAELFIALSWKLFTAHNRPVFMNAIIKTVTNPTTARQT